MAMDHSKLPAPMLTVGDVARLADRSPDCVRYWARTGKIPFVATVKGVRLFELSDVQQFLHRKYSSQRRTK